MYFKHYLRKDEILTGNNVAETSHLNEMSQKTICCRQLKFGEDMLKIILYFFAHNPS